MPPIRPVEINAHNSDLHWCPIPWVCKELPKIEPRLLQCIKCNEPLLNPSFSVVGMYKDSGIVVLTCTRTTCCSMQPMWGVCLYCGRKHQKGSDTCGLIHRRQKKRIDAPYKLKQHHRLDFHRANRDCAVKHYTITRSENATHRPSTNHHAKNT